MSLEDTNMFGRRIGYNERKRRRKRSRIRRKRIGSAVRWYKRKGWILTLLFVIACVALWQSRFYLNQINPLEFRHLQYIEIEGNRMLSWEDVVQSAQVETGMLMSELDADSVKKSLLQIPLIHSAEVESKFPSSLFIKIQEASPILSVLENGKGTVYSERGLSLPMSMMTALHMPILENESVGKVKQVALFLSAMRKMDKQLYERVSQVGWSEKDRAFEVFFKDVGFRVMFPESNWDKDLFTLYDAIGKGFRRDLLCASEVDMRFHGFAYIKNIDKRCING
ncbi:MULTISPECIES: cell division protein FtsQ/DivIB [unclassified Fibrobacter]|uniref:cell division protein FtsQ/DivIB n=1 Tax=unclassified Fibrobacter TaxID=2634177 RepID=UPI0020C90D82|nr:MULTISPECIES: FtsQ-type POTRA domain-containing protein [unclassified Fibrobacter]